jgi:hypothetical protein
MKEVLEVIKESERLELGSQFEIGNYEESFLGDTPAIIEISISNKKYRAPVKRLIDGMKALQPSHGNLDDIETLLKSITEAG